MKIFSGIVSLLISLSALGAQIDKTKAVVNSDVILQSDVTQFRKNFSLRKEIDPFLGITSRNFSDDRDVLEYLIQETLVSQKLPATEAETEEEITAVQRSNKIDRNKLKEILTSQGVEFSDYKKMMQISVSKRKLLDRDLRGLAIVTDEEVKNAYYTDPAYRNRASGQRLVLTYSLSQVLIPTKDLSQEISRRLKAGQDFDAVASEYASKGVESTKLGNISENNMNEKIRSSIQGMKVNESTDPIPAGSGYIILKITEIGAPKDPVFEQEREKLRSVLFQKALTNQLRMWTERERNASYVHIP